MPSLESQPPSNLSTDALVFHPLPVPPRPIPQWVLSGQSLPSGSNTKWRNTSTCRDIVADLNWSKMMMFGSIDISEPKRQGRNSTPSSNGSVTSSWRRIQKGLQGAVREYLQAPLVSTLPHPEFPMAGPSTSHSSGQLEEGLRQMLDIITGMSDQALLDQGSQGSRKSSQTIWKIADQGRTTTLDKWREYIFNGKTCFLMLKNLGFRKEEPDSWKGFCKGYRKNFW